jgi:hypothetical protein
VDSSEEFPPCAHGISDRHHATRLTRTWFIAGSTVREEGTNGEFYSVSFVDH